MSGPTRSWRQDTRRTSRRPARNRWLALVAALAFFACEVGAPAPRPNFLFCISDDQSWRDAGAYGNPDVATPNFDRIADEGILFRHAFAPSPSCTPSRGAILTGQDMWRLREGSVLHGTLPSDLSTYPEILAAAGYHVGHTGKGWGPGQIVPGGRTDHPAGPRYAERLENAPVGIAPLDYAAGFRRFLDERGDDQPFAFWFGALEPHYPYRGHDWSGSERLADVGVPGYLPATAGIRSELLDYYFEIEWFDAQLGQLIETLTQRGELDDTIIVVTSDNGMAAPRAKASLYDAGTRVPLAIRWGMRAPGGRVVEDFVNLIDIAPTFLEAAGLSVPADMTGRSLLPILLASRGGRLDPQRDFVATGYERHGADAYPSRAMRTFDYLYIRNYEPDRWPTAPNRPPPLPPEASAEAKATQGAQVLMRLREDPEIAPFAALAFDRRGPEELYALAGDPDQLHDLAADPAYAEIKQSLAARLTAYLRATADPRETGQPIRFDDYPSYDARWRRNHPETAKEWDRVVRSSHQHRR